MPPKKKSKAKKKNAEEIDNKLVKALAHPIRAKALSILNSRIASPKELAAQMGLPLGNVSYHVTQLEELGCIEEVSRAQRRGATEHYYRGITRSFLNDKNWSALSGDAKTGLTVAALKTQDEATLAALEAGTFDAREDRHVSRSPLILDERGWAEMVDLLSDTLDMVWEIQDRATTRQAEEGSERIPTTVSILGFESPPSPPGRDNSA